MGRAKKWSKEEDEFLIYAFNLGKSWIEIAEGLDNRGPIAIKTRAYRLGLRVDIPPKELNDKYRCSRCKEYKDKDEFYICKDGRVYAYCGECKRIYAQENSTKNILNKGLEQYSKSNNTKFEVNNNNPYKVCTSCNTEKSIDLFPWKKIGSKLHSSCSECRTKKNKEYKHKMLRTKGHL